MQINCSNLEPDLKPTIKHGGGSIQVWGCISSGGVGKLLQIDGIINCSKVQKVSSTILSPVVQDFVVNKNTKQNSI
uniref:Uncharacterized protein n=1 Tax=Eptatretus burgeri TaxID=7764 RepID=A0A8C4N801_EPTBU